MSVPANVYSDSKTIMTSGLARLTHGLEGIGVALVTKWLCNGIWFDQISTPIYTTWTPQISHTYSTQYLVFSAAVTSGHFVLTTGSVTTGLIQGDASYLNVAANIQAAFNVIPGYENVIAQAFNSHGWFAITFLNVIASVPLVSVSSNTTGLSVTPTMVVAASGPNAIDWTPQ